MKKGAIAAGIAALALGACDEDTQILPPAPPPAPKVIVTTRVRTFDPSAAKRDATWAAYERPDGTWAVLASTSPGTYEIELPPASAAASTSPARWAIAIACASEDDAYTSVSIHRRTGATRSLDLALDRQCAHLVEAHTLTGALVNVPVTSGWFDFGYADEARGVAIPTGTSRAPFELVNVLDGSWDLAFGVRDSSFSALTRMAILRDQVVDADRALDVDMTGPSSFLPASRQLVVRGIAEDESLEEVFRYATRGPAGLDVGPPDVPLTRPDVTTTYATVPAEAQRPGDRYRGTLTAKSGNDDHARKVTFDLHEAVDLDERLPERLPPPFASLVTATPYPRTRTTLPTAATVGASYTLRMYTRVGRRQEHTWRVTFDAASAGASIDDTLPDLSGLPGFRARWGLGADGDIEVTATATEPARAIAGTRDGTVERASSATVYVTP